MIWTLKPYAPLEDAIEAFPGTIMVISHDRWFLDRVATHILAFEGDSKAVWFDGNYSEYEADHQKRTGDKRCNTNTGPLQKTRLITTL